jgi:hypothetical protein
MKIVFRFFCKVVGQPYGLFVSGEECGSLPAS